MNTPSAPKLAPPGAGLPQPELWMARILFRLKRQFWTRDGFTRQFQDERAQITQLVAGVEPTLRSMPVLIPRLRGLEDSSRCWSVWMTLDHLRITNTVFAGVIKGLVAGQAPQKKASTADVKPSTTANAEVETAFGASCDELVGTVSAIPSLTTRTTYSHPWFGPLDAANWHALAATHMKIHRAQLECIIHHLRNRR